MKRLLNKELIDKLKKITAEEKKILKGCNIDKSIYMENTDNVINSQKILSGGKQIDVRPHTRFVHFPEHSHDYVEIVYMCTGSTTHIINGEELKLGKGELLFLCPSAKQEILPAGFDDVAVNFIVLPEFFTLILQLIGEDETPIKNFIVDCLSNKKSKINYLHFTVSDVLPIQNLIENLIFTMLYSTSNKRKINQITMGVLFLHLINHTDKLISSGNEEQLIVKVLKYVEDNYANGSLMELADILHYDVSVLSREIKYKTGKKYTELVQDKRLSQSCFLLKNTNLNIDEIANKIGYENLSFFYRMFKSKYNTTPRNYRQSHMKREF